MTWLRIDDSMPQHPKIAHLSDAAFRLHVTGLAYCARLLTDGHIPEVAALQMRSNRSRKPLDELVAAGLWDREEGGFTIHDYTDYNPTREQVTSRRKVRSEAGKLGADARWHPSQTPSQTPSQIAWQNDGSTHERVHAPHPALLAIPPNPRTAGERRYADELQPISASSIPLTPRQAGTNPRAIAAAATDADREKRAHEALVARARDQYEAWITAGDQPTFAAEQLRECFPAVADEVLP